MPPLIRIYRAGQLLSTTAGAEGESLYERIVAADIYIEAPCAGTGKCGKCLVQLAPNGEKVLACRTFIQGDTDVYLPDDAQMKIAGDAAAHNAYTDGGPLGVAVDIGTTTVVAHLTDLSTCTRLATASGVNAQRAYGADVISRILYCTENGHDVLTRLIREQLADLIRQACRSAGADPKDVHYISIAGNTVMQHLADNLSPAGMGQAPFLPETLFGDERQADPDFHVADDAVIYYAPCVSSFVGGDITAGILAADLENIPGPCVYVDIGTNGELVLKIGDIYYCCATAAGPAFEGAEITKGISAVQGAVSHIQWRDEGLVLTVLGDTAPAGLCGSGLMAALAVLVSTGAVDETGRLLDSDDLSHPISKHLGKRGDDHVFWLSRTHDVYMTAGDIRKLQLAKAAIAGGISTLLHTAGIAVDDVSTFLLAGGFGSFLDQNSAAIIGLFPKAFLPFARTVENTAGEGAAIALCSEQARGNLKEILDKCKVVDLSISKIFNEQFIDHLMFDAL